MLEGPWDGCEDMRPTLDVAVRFGQTHGVSAELAKAMRLLLDDMKGLSGVSVQHIRTWAQIFLLLDSSPELKRSPCWSLRFQQALPSMPSEERAAWTAFVLAIKPSLQITPAPIWHERSRKLIESIGSERIVERLEQWLPTPSEDRQAIAVNGSHLLKYFVWLLSVLVREETLSERCDRLASDLSRLDWRPRDRAAKVATACSMYFSERPFEVGEAPLDRLVAFSRHLEDGDRIVEFRQLFMHRHRPN